MTLMGECAKVIESQVGGRLVAMGAQACMVRHQQKIANTCASDLRSVEAKHSYYRIGAIHIMVIFGQQMRTFFQWTITVALVKCLSVVAQRPAAYLCILPMRA